MTEYDKFCQLKAALLRLKATNRIQTLANIFSLLICDSAKTRLAFALRKSISKIAQKSTRSNTSRAILFRKMKISPIV